MTTLKFFFLELDIDFQKLDRVVVTAYALVPPMTALNISANLSHFVYPSGGDRIRIGQTTLSVETLSWTEHLHWPPLPPTMLPNMLPFRLVDPEKFYTGLEYTVKLSVEVETAAIIIDARLDAKFLGKVVMTPFTINERWEEELPKALPRKIGNADIAHVVVLMLENRSFDNVLGWLYEDTQNRPPLNIPPQDPPTYAGLVANRYWCPRDRADVGLPDDQVPEDRRVYATRGTSKSNIPDPDPCEQFKHMNFQLFGKENPLQPPTATPPQPTMKGFVVDYAEAIAEERAKAEAKTDPKAKAAAMAILKDADARTIMQTYAPERLPVLTTLARNYAVCDRWFASVPCQTWPNRGFAHAGTSCGRVNNLNTEPDGDGSPDPLYYDTSTIFNVMFDAGVGWKVYGDSKLPTLTRYQFLTQLYGLRLNGRFRGLDEFKKDASLGKLPSYSFVEPDFMLKGNDAHPPHDVPAADAFIYEVWHAVRNGPGWNNTLLIITCDEHGGCYDHVPPPWGAVRPDDTSTQKPYEFGFDRYGVRVPTIVISPWVEAGTVFRAKPGGAEFDHTSILATLRDWHRLDNQAHVEWLESRRIASAPTLASVLTRKEARIEPQPLDVPVPATMPAPPPPAATIDVPLNVLQRSILAATLLEAKLRKPMQDDYARVAEQVRQVGNLANAMKNHWIGPEFQISPAPFVTSSQRKPAVRPKKKATKSRPKPRLASKPKPKARKKKPRQARHF